MHCQVIPNLPPIAICSTVALLFISHFCQELECFHTLRVLKHFGNHAYGGGWVPGDDYTKSQQTLTGLWSVPITDEYDNHLSGLRAPITLHY